MKKLLIIALIVGAFSCKKQDAEPFGAPVDKEVSEGMPTQEQTPEALGEKVFKGKGNCVACHQVDKKVIGPSIQEIASVYKAKGGNIIAFLKDDAKPIVDPSQYEVMKTNFALTKAMSTEELEGLQAYIYSNAK